MKLTNLSPTFSVTAQITPDDLPLLREAGFRAVVNNRPDNEEPGQPLSSQLRVEAQHLGLRYTHIPIIPGHMTDEQAVALDRAVAEANGPVLAFCRSGARSTALWNRSRELARQRA